MAIQKSGFQTLSDKPLPPTSTTLRQARRWKPSLPICQRQSTTPQKIAESCNIAIDFKTNTTLCISRGFRRKLHQEEQVQAVEKFLWKLCEEGIETRYTPERLAKVAELYPGKDPNQVVRERLIYEMGVIAPKGWPITC